MDKKKPFNVDDAYALETPADSIRLYGDWAKTYDAEFVETSGYVAFLRVSERLLRYRADIDGPVLDIGCGTGIVGACLREGGIAVVDGIDISPPMLAEAGKKNTPDGDSVYRNLIAADLTAALELPDDQYAGLISAGTFTHGHLGPEPLDELWRIAVPGARCAIGVRTTHYEKAGFSEKFAADVASGLITQPQLIEIKMYSAEADDPEHAHDKAFVVDCQVLK